MQTTSVVTGVIVFFLSTIARWIGIKNSSVTWQIKNLFTIPSKDDQGGIIAANGQVMGTLWIGVGIILSQAEEWFSSSLTGIIAEPILVFAPFLLGRVIIKLLMTPNRYKGT